MRGILLLSAAQDTMAQIQALSNERLRLYGEKWSKRNMPMYRETIKRLDRQIAELWKDHRSALARGLPALQAAREVTQAMIQHSSEEMGATAPSGYQVSDGDRWINVEVNELTTAISRYVFDIPADDPDEIVEVPPLKEVLRRRGLTLRWEPLRGGSGYHRLASL